MNQYPLVLGGNEQQYSLIDCNDSQYPLVLTWEDHAFSLDLDGAFDSRVIDFHGSVFIAEVHTGQMRLTIPVFLIQQDELTAVLEHERAPLHLRQNLSGEVSAIAGTSGRMSLSMQLHMPEQVAELHTSPAPLSQVSLAYVSDWSDYQMDALSDYTMDQMIYKEVEN